MSFSSDVRSECADQMPGKRHCQIAELSAILSMSGGVSISAADRVSIRIATENVYAARKFSALIRKLYKIPCEVSVRTNKSRSPGHEKKIIVLVPGHEDAMRILTDTCQNTHNLLQAEEEMADARREILSRQCCRRAYLRGAFLTCGSISDPKRFYHFEMVCQSREQAEMLQELIAAFSLTPRIVQRKRYHVVYIKDAEQIVEMLGIMEAPRSLMEMENIRILREISGSVNRQVNCETANLKKTVGAAVKQCEDIRYIQEQGGFSSLPEHLKQIAQLRLENPDMALKDLGQLMDPPLGKSGVNHRLKAIGEIAERMREERP